MRKLIVGNFLALDGYYESVDKTFGRFCDYWYEGYGDRSGVRSPGWPGAVSAVPLLGQPRRR